MTVKEVTNIIANFAPLAYQATYDNAGLLVGNAQDNVEGVLICLDSTEAVVDEAIKKKCNLIIAHHPIIFDGIKQLNGKNYIERTIIKAIKNNIAIYACHTNVDNIFNGVNFKIAEKIGLKNCKILAPQSHKVKKIVVYCPVNEAGKVREAMFKSGGGKIGDYSECSFNSVGKGTFKGNETTKPFVGEIGKIHYEEEVKIEMIAFAHQVPQVVEALIKAHPYEEVAHDIYPIENDANKIGSGIIGELTEPEDELAFLKRLKVDLKTNCIRHTSLLNKKVKKIAICGGSGSFLLPQAKTAQADVFITADFKYHQFFDAENELIIADIGHYESEQFTSELFYELLKEKMPNFALYLSEINTNPVNYL